MKCKLVKVLEFQRNLRNGLWDMWKSPLMAPGKLGFVMDQFLNCLTILVEVFHTEFEGNVSNTGQCCRSQAYYDIHIRCSEFHVNVLSLWLFHYSVLCLYYNVNKIYLQKV
jgi:hypothetical protein